MFLRHLIWRHRQKFMKEFEVPFPRSQEERATIHDIVVNRLVKVGGEVEAAEVELEEKSGRVFDPTLDQGTQQICFIWSLRACAVIKEKGKLYRQLQKLAQSAGFSKEDLAEADSRAKKVGSQGGLIFRTG